MSCYRLLIFGILTGFWLVFVQGDVFKISRKLIVQANDDVIMKAYYKNIDWSKAKFNISWFKESSEIKMESTGRRKFNKEGTQLQIIKVETRDAGNYKCNFSLLNNSTFLTNFELIVETEPLPVWAIILIIIGLVFLLIGTALYFRCRRDISDMVQRNKPRRKRKTTSETSFQE